MDDYYYREAHICLNCEKPVCTNCLAGGGGKRSQFKPQWNEREVQYIIREYNAGNTANAIALHLHMRPGTFTNQMHRLGVTFSGNRPKLTLDYLEEKQNELLLTRPHSQRLI